MTFKLSFINMFMKTNELFLEKLQVKVLPIRVHHNELPDWILLVSYTPTATKEASFEICWCIFFWLNIYNWCNSFYSSFWNFFFLVKIKLWEGCYSENIHYDKFNILHDSKEKSNWIYEIYNYLRRVRT